MLSKEGVKKIISRLVVSVVVVSVLATCTQQEWDKNSKLVMRDPIDREADITRNEAKRYLRPERKFGEEKKKVAESPIPSFSPVILAPEPPQVESTKKVSLSVTQDVDIKDVLLELARLAELELALDPNISGGIILSVADRPVNEVIDMVAELADLRYEVKDKMLKVLKDDPYLKNYSVAYLNLVRSSKGTMNTQTQVLAVGVGEADVDASGLNSGSQNELSMEYSGDLWSSIENNLVAILGANLDTLIAGYKSAAASAAQAAQAASDAASKEVISPTDSNVVSKVVPTAQPTASEIPNTYYTINKQAGIISVMANSRKHKSVQEYLEKVKMSVSAQVVIEAKVVEVALDEAYSTGIDWSSVGADFGSEGLKGQLLYGPDVSKVFDGKNVFTGVVTTSQIASVPSGAAAISNVLKAIEGFGLTRTLSNPRITAMNNQQAVLTFAKNQTYYTVTGTVETANTTNNQTTGTPVTITSTLHTIPIGVILSIQPSINLETQEITMHVRPTLSTQVEDGIDDPAVTILNRSVGTVAGQTNLGDINSKVPIVQVRELDTVLKAKSGDVMIIGGLIQHEDKSSDLGLPFISRIPIIGNATKKVEKQTQVIETVILMQAFIVPPNGYYHKQDKKVYETFAQDPRPLVF